MIVLGHHPDAVALSQTRQEIFIGPGGAETRLLDLKNLGHIPANQPADLHVETLFNRTVAHDCLLAQFAVSAAVDDPSSITSAAIPKINRGVDSGKDRLPPEISDEVRDSKFSGFGPTFPATPADASAFLRCLR
jgi:hypothetical protein